MAKFPSRKLSGTKKIASRGFSKSKVKIASRGFTKGTAKIASRKIAKPSVAEEKPTAPVRIYRPTDEQSREDRLAALQGQVKSLKPASDL